MTMTDERPTVPTKVIPGYGENPEQPRPPADAGGSIAQVEAAREGHPTDPRLEKIKCQEKNCGKMITRKNMDQHKRNVHKIFKRKGKETAIFPADQLPEKTIKRAKPTADEIVLITVQMRWPNGVPIDKVPALLAWQRDTERFFNE